MVGCDYLPAAVSVQHPVAVLPLTAPPHILTAPPTAGLGHRLGALGLGLGAEAALEAGLEAGVCWRWLRPDSPVPD